MSSIRSGESAAPPLEQITVTLVLLQALMTEEDLSLGDALLGRMCSLGGIPLDQPQVASLYAS